MLRTGITLDQLIILIRIGAFRFTGQPKKDLLWETHSILNKPIRKTEQSVLFNSTQGKKFILPTFETSPIEDAYDDIELLGFPV